MSQQLVLDYMFGSAADAIAFIQAVTSADGSVRVSMMGSTADASRGFGEQWAVRAEGPLTLAQFADPTGFLAPPPPPPPIQPPPT